MSSYQWDDTCKAGPGWIIIEDVREDQKETVTAGGIVLPENEELNSSIVKFGRVLDCGEYIATGRTGRLGHGNVIRERGWLKTGDVVQYIPHNPWRLKGVSGEPRYAIKAEDVLVYHEEAKKPNRAIDTIFGDSNVNN